MSIATLLSQLSSIKTAIKTAIIGKGQTVGNDMTTYASAISSISSQPNLQSKSVSPTTSQQTVSPDNGYDGLSSVTVGAIATETKTATPSTSQQTITPTSGKYLTQVTVSAIQTETKTATPSTSQQSITPTSGKYLTQVTVSAIQTETKSATPSTSQQNVTPTSGKYLTQVTVGAVTSSIDANITAANIKKDVTILGVTGTYEGSGGSTLVPTAGDYPVIENPGMGRVAVTSLASTGISITIPVTGTYRLKWTAFRSSTGGTNTSQLYRTRNGTTSAIGSTISTWTDSYYQTNTLDISCNKDDVIIVYARSRGTSYSVCAGNLSACVAQKLWTN